MVRLTFFVFYLLLGSAVVAEPVAKELFSAQSGASSQRPAAWGSYAKGCLAGAAQLAETGATWQAMRLGRNRNWGHPDLIDFIERLSRKAARLKGWNGIYVGDLSQPRGGPMGGGHRSHQTGLDVDIWMRPARDLTLSRETRESLSSISMRRAKGAYTNESWSPQHMQLLKAAAQDPAVARIFLFPGAKVQMCNEARGNRDWLRKIRPWWGHYAHFHVRLNCPDGVRGCVEQAPPPPGDGCAEAQTWVDNILNPPPPPVPDPNAPKPQKRQPLILSDLPAQCTKVISSR
ncbi:penicillin-insensitive murein endopeptidase [Candidatus Halocynthiibacter alkanivorans]|uniref:penicillin-insensitive murein endopeptidase n=1 Tax=Candidatus Halocynthiibacter alkanivorans TaxID=2267619 RepID=UPI000DF1D2C0|nr:penicillin-insensitive murein endopeptidase [Candidatus Halocynthiibacter alkanivorans]